MGDICIYKYEHGSIGLRISVETREVEIFATAVMRKLTSKKQKVGTLGAFTFSEQGLYEGLGDWSGDPGPECPSHLLESMKRCRRLFNETVDVAYLTPTEADLN